MDIRGKKLLVIGGAGLIGSHTVDTLLREDVREIVIYDNFVRGRPENLVAALKDPRVKVYEVGGDICQTDILESAMTDVDGVFHFAALWLLQCHDFPRAAFDVHTRHLQRVRGLRKEERQAAGVLLLGLGLRGRAARADGRGPPVQQQELLWGDQDRRGGHGARFPPSLRAAGRRAALHERVRTTPGLSGRLHRGHHEDARVRPYSGMAAKRSILSPSRIAPRRTCAPCEPKSSTATTTSGPASAPR
jgi:hypothetical protein